MINKSEHENKRYDFTNCPVTIAENFVNNLEHNVLFTKKAFLDTTDKCHFKRYNFAYGNEKVSLVYDTKANILSITSCDIIIDKLKEMFEKQRGAGASTVKPIESDNNKQINLNIVKSSVQPSKTNLQPQNVQMKNNELKEKPKAQPAKKLQKIEQKNQQKNIKMSEKIQANKIPDKAEIKNTEEVKNPVTEQPLEYKNGFSIKKYPPDRFDGVLKRIKSVDGTKLKLEGVTFTNTPQETITYCIEDRNKQKVILRFMTKKQSLQLQGKRSNLFGEVQVLISNDSDYLSAVNSHIELVNEDKKAADVQKQLKKLIPDAFGFLSDQSKIDMTYGLIDIGNAEVKLSDYSVLLVPPYRGLEKFISDLQKAQSIDVKMIGQAYEKLDGKYVLKIGYRKKIQSVVYEEVMSALYTEYFEKRNFYAHSDNTPDSLPRCINDKNQAKIIFDNLLELINYNCRKLKEINFAIK